MWIPEEDTGRHELYFRKLNFYFKDFLFSVKKFIGR